MNIDFFLLMILSTALAKHNVTYFVIKDLSLSNFCKAQIIKKTKYKCCSDNHIMDSLK